VASFKNIGLLQKYRDNIGEFKKTYGEYQDF